MQFKKYQTVKEISEFIGSECPMNSDFIIKGLNRIEDAESADITFFYNPKYEKYLHSTQATCIIVPLDFDDTYFKGKILLFSAEPHAAFVKIVRFIEDSKRKVSPSIHSSAVIGKNTIISPNAFIGANCVIGDNCSIGEFSQVKAGTVIEDNVKIGANSIINPNVTIYEETVIGDNCIIHSGAVIGSDGFGFEEQADGSWIKIPQIGNVIIGDNVEIGSNSTVDRALIGSTFIESGVKIDNLVQIAHNVRIGKNSAMASQVGISGSSKIGERNRFGGQVGLAGHLKTADDVIIYAQSGVAKSVDSKGIYFGSPAKPRISAFKIEAALNELPEMVRNYKKLKEEIDLIKSNIQDKS
jgi:UDP-3-O-[3-hydroxymyristoyl] glucosamine N-acyltransferase